MIDVVGEALRAAAARSALAYPLAFAAGLATSVGPCAAPRYVAVAALAHGARRPWTVTAPFAAGLVGAYVALGLGAGMLGALWSASAVVYAALAAVMAFGGVVTLLRAGAAVEPHACAVNAKPHEYDERASASAGGTFLLGASSALVVSPCCTPVVAALAAALSTGATASGVALLAAFACGHVVPVVAADAAGMRFSHVLRRWTASQAPAIVAGSLMLALAAYYGALA